MKSQGARCPYMHDLYRQSKGGFRQKETGQDMSAKEPSPGVIDTFVLTAV